MGWDPERRLKSDDFPKPEERDDIAVGQDRNSRMDSWRIYEKIWHQRTLLERYQAQCRFCRPSLVSDRVAIFR